MSFTLPTSAFLIEEQLSVSFSFPQLICGFLFMLCRGDSDNILLQFHRKLAEDVYKGGVCVTYGIISLHHLG